MRLPIAFPSLVQRISLSLIATTVCFTAFSNAQEPTPFSNPIMAILQRRVQENPTHADSWRLIGKIHHRDGKSAQAREALRKALAADPESVAAHFDFGQLLESMGDRDTALRHYSAVSSLAPESSYALKLIERGIVADVADGEAAILAAIRMQASIPTQSVTPVAYEIQTFDGSEAFERQLKTLETIDPLPTSRLRAFVETGLLYNSNVSLTPISRELVDVNAAAFQGFLNPELEFILIHSDLFRSGPLTRGYFALNERHQSAFNLASFQGGWFAERDFGSIDHSFVGRLDYVYSLDLQGGNRFGDRHAINVSATSVTDSSDILYLYGTLSLSNFDDDGFNPSVDSLDGPGFISGVTRFFQTDWDHLRTFRLGADVSSADTEGADYRFFGAGMNGGFTFALSNQLSIEPEMGLGFRVYDDFTGAVDRDEVVIRLAAKLKRQFSNRIALALVIGYDRFASGNEDFDAERTEGGIVTSWLY